MNFVQISSVSITTELWWPLASPLQVAELPTTVTRENICRYRSCPFSLRMVRKLKFHEQKLLKKVDFISWEVDNNIHEVKVMKKYCIQKREDYTK